MISHRCMHRRRRHLPLELAVLLQVKNESSSRTERIAGGLGISMALSGMKRLKTKRAILVQQGKGSIVSEYSGRHSIMFVGRDVLRSKSVQCACLMDKTRQATGCKEACRVKDVCAVR